MAPPLKKGDCNSFSQFLEGVEDQVSEDVQNLGHFMLSVFRECYERHFTREETIARMKVYGLNETTTATIYSSILLRMNTNLREEYDQSSIRASQERQTRSQKVSPDQRIDMLLEDINVLSFSLSQVQNKSQEMSTTSDKNFETVMKAINDLHGLPLANFETVMKAINDLHGLPLARLSTEEETPVPWPNGVKYEFQTLPVDPSDVGDGDGISVYVRATDPFVPSKDISVVTKLAAEIEIARKDNNTKKANQLQQEISKYGYRVIKSENDYVLAYKVRIRLRGIDAPELEMEFGIEAQQGLLDIVEGNVLTVLGYENDRYGRCIADLHCDGIFVQEEMLKKGFAWHYSAYDTRANFAKWHKEAKQKKMGLWASPNPPVKPWEWRRNHRAQS